MPVVDPSGIQVSVSVMTARGATFPLWMGGARTSDKIGGGDSIFLDANVPFRDLPIVTGVNIEMSMNYNASCTVELSAPYDLGLELLESELFIIGNVITVQVGYPRINLWLPRLSTMGVKPSISLDPDGGLTATLNGQGGIFASMRSQSTRRWEGISAKEAIENVANLKHNKWTIEFPSQIRRGSVTDREDPLYLSRVAVNQRGETDWAFTTRILRAVGCRATVRPIPEGGATRIVVQRDSDVAREAPVYTLVSRGQIDMVAPNGRFPLLSFESEAEGVWLSAGSDRTTTADISSTTGEQTSEEADQETIADDSPNATTGTVGTGSGEVDGVNVAGRAAAEDGGDRHIPLPDNSTETTPREGVTQNTREEAERGGGMNVTVSTIGNPLAFPNERIRIENVGLFSGNYEIEGMSHQVGEGDWTTTMKLIRRGSVQSEHISELLRRPQDWDASDQEPVNQPDIGEDAESSGDLVEPVALGEDEFAEPGNASGA